VNNNASGSLRVERRIVLNASADAVWALTGDFGQWDSWHPGIDRCELTEGGKNQPGTVRKLGLGDQERQHFLVERLLHHSNADKSCTYCIVSGVLPVLNYESTFRVADTTDGKSEIFWSGTFDADGLSDEKTTDIIANIYETGFAALQQRFG